MRPSLVHFLLTMCIVCVTSSSPATAQPQNIERNTGDAPPKLEKLEENEAPAVTIKGSRPQTQITETRERGRVTSIEVKSGNSTYYLKPNASSGTALPGDAQSNITRGAQWQVLEFDLKRPTDAKQAAGQAGDAPMPPPTPSSTPPARKQ